MNRYRLSIGISAYSQPKHQLNNPSNDATLVTRTLEALGFEIELLLDSDLSAIEASRSFDERLT